MELYYPNLHLLTLSAVLIIRHPERDVCLSPRSSVSERNRIRDLTIQWAHFGHVLRRENHLPRSFGEVFRLQESITSTSSVIAVVTIGRSYLGVRELEGVRLNWGYPDCGNLLEDPNQVEKQEGHWLLIVLSHSILKSRNKSATVHEKVLSS